MRKISNKIQRIWTQNDTKVYWKVPGLSYPHPSSYNALLQTIAIYHDACSICSGRCSPSARLSTRFVYSLKILPLLFHIRRERSWPFRSIWTNLPCGILFIGFGRAKTVPYKSFYNWPPTLKLPVERGHPTTPRPAVRHIKNPQRTLPHP